MTPSMTITTHKDGSHSAKCHRCGGELHTDKGVEEMKRLGQQHLDWHAKGAPMKVV